ncbi:MAG: hypothetical protein KAS16_08485 [Thermoplasmata archaeon]|nr:hypothetical protein [Thermoplasmata archaeon]
MPECKRLGACPFFNDEMADKPGMTKLYKKNYCMSDSSQCARYMVAEVLGPEGVPPDLYPNMINKVDEILASQ